MEGTIADPIWWQILKIILFLGLSFVAIRFASKILFPESGNSGELDQGETEEPPEAWLRGEKVAPEYLRPGDCLLRDDGKSFVFMRKAEADEYREGVEEWLFHPPGKKDDLWIGLTREQMEDLRLIVDNTGRPE